MPWYFRLFDPASQQLDFEDMILYELGYSGPIVAVADPADQEATFGVAKWTLAGDTWKSFVATQIQTAQLIVVSVAETTGLTWEIETVRDSQALARTIFLFPPQTARDPTLLIGLAHTLGLSGVQSLHPEEWGDASLLALAQRRPDIEPVLFVGSSFTQLHYCIALRLATIELSDHWQAG